MRRCGGAAWFRYHTRTSGPPLACAAVLALGPNTTVPRTGHTIPAACQPPGGSTDGGWQGP